MDTFDTIHALRQWRTQSTLSIALVPTMGALHEGHLALVDEARRLVGEQGRVVVSIFVNPTQFGPDEDLSRYPRSMDADLAACEAHGVDVVLAPAVDDVYPPAVPGVELDVPMLTADLEGARRPGHFGGVCRVVAKLLNIVQPHFAVFGQKDYQQLLTIRTMAADLAMPVAIQGVPTVRESDGLALSSRNRYLTDAQRPHALGLIKALRLARSMVERDGEADPQAIERAMGDAMLAHHLDVDYAVIRHPRTLVKLDTAEHAGGMIALVAARLGEVRLIDNMLVGIGEV